MVWVQCISQLVNNFKTKSVNSSMIFMTTKRLICTSLTNTTPSKGIIKTQDAGGYSSGESLDPIKMAYSSYETTKSSDLLNLSPVIIMHGLLGSKNNWNSLSKAIHSKTNLKIFAVDARNHGDSSHTPEMTYPHLAEDVRALLHDLGLKSATLIGHSMGGRAMMMTALRYPELVDQLVVVDISPIGSSPSLYLLPKYFDAMDNVKIEAHISMSAARASADKQLSTTIPDEGVRRFIIANLVGSEDGRFKWRLNLSAIAKNFRNLADFPPVGNTFDKPTLFIAGGDSDYIKVQDHESIKQLFTNAQFVEIQDAGHWVHSEKPNEFVSIVSRFLLNQPELLH